LKTQYYNLFAFRGKESQDKTGLGITTSNDLDEDDNEFDAYRKRMMLAYRFRPNPLVSNIFN
jgi:splicing factor 4